MNGLLVWRLAIRYIRGKRSANAVPILSRISMIAIAVGAGAMIIIFSVFNGLESLVKDRYKAFYPEVKVSPEKGKFFYLSNGQLNTIKHLSGVENTSRVIEDKVLTSSGDEQQILTIKGIDSNYLKVNDVKQYIIAGRDSVSTNQPATAIVGEHIANTLGVDVNNAFSRITLYYLNDLSANPMADIASATRSLVLKPDGVFRVQDELDSKYILAPLPLVQDLFQQNDKYSSVEISLLKDTDPDKVKSAIKRIVGNTYKVETRYEQNKTLYVVMETEKWAVYAVLLLVLIIASFNMIGALSLLVLEKRKDMAILKAMGAQPGTIRAIFILEGILWSLAGGIAGIILSTLICIGQQHFQWIKLSGNFIVEAYPVSMQLSDYLLVIATIIIVGLLASIYPAIRATSTEDPSLKST